MDRHERPYRAESFSAASVVGKLATGPTVAVYLFWRVQLRGLDTAVQAKRRKRRVGIDCTYTWSLDGVVMVTVRYISINQDLREFSRKSSSSKATYNTKDKHSVDPSFASWMLAEEKGTRLKISSRVY